MRNCVLILEPDAGVSRFMQLKLEEEGFNCLTDNTGDSAVDLAGQRQVDIILLDPDSAPRNGMELLGKVREISSIPIIYLSSDSSVDTKVAVLNAGADDYITKPFSLSVLLLKIEAHFRRRQEKTEAGKMISGDIVFIAGEMKGLIKSREISLTKTELKMLTFFLQNPKQILSKTQILENVFDLEGDFVDENTIAVNIRRLREKIEDNPAAPVYIKNIRGLGYIWNQEVRQ